jgi:hypothetical protein
VGQNAIQVAVDLPGLVGRVAAGPRTGFVLGDLTGHEDEISGEGGVFVGQAPRDVSGLEVLT